MRDLIRTHTITKAGSLPLHHLYAIIGKCQRDLSTVPMGAFILGPTFTRLLKICVNKNVYINETKISQTKQRSSVKKVCNELIAKTVAQDHRYSFKQIPV